MISSPDTSTDAAQCLPYWTCSSSPTISSYAHTLATAPVWDHAISLSLTTSLTRQSTGLLACPLVFVIIFSCANITIVFISANAFTTSSFFLSTRVISLFTRLICGACRVIAIASFSSFTQSFSSANATAWLKIAHVAWLTHRQISTSSCGIGFFIMTIRLTSLSLFPQFHYPTSLTIP